MTKSKYIKAYINPLQFLEIDEPWSEADKQSSLSAQSIINFICKPNLPSDISSLVDRYKEISQEKKRINVAPAEERILEKLIWPLRYAKSSYMLGNYLGTISLCGMVAEMVSILLFEISNFKLNNREMTIENQKQIFGSSFEKLNQDRRVNILNAYEIIDSEIKNAFDLIRSTRRKYLHLWSQDHDILPNDAVKIYNAAIILVIRVIGQDFEKGKILLNPALIKYLEKTGVYTEDDEI